MQTWLPQSARQEVRDNTFYIVWHLLGGISGLGTNFPYDLQTGSQQEANVGAVAVGRSNVENNASEVKYFSQLLVCEGVQKDTAKLRIKGRRY